MSTKLFRVFTVFLVAGLILASCATPDPEVIEIETIVTQEVEVPVEVLITAIPEEEEMVGDGSILITWWSHWANEPSKRAVIEKIAADYEAENPEVDILLTWWDKNPLMDAVRSTFTAGTGMPDISTEVPGASGIEYIEAGWWTDLTDVLPWENFSPGTQKSGSYPHLGYPGTYKYNIGLVSSMLFYNIEVFEELGIEVPESKQFTQAEYLDVIETCNAGGYAGVADAIGNRPYPGTWSTEYALWNMVGPDGFDAYMNGKTSWDTPEARDVLEYSVALRDAGFWPSTLSTMTIDEFHVYFHTQKKSCMLMIPSWYSGRAFKAMEEGGQDPNWHFGMLKPTAMDNGVANNVLRVGYESGYAISSFTEYPEIAKDILLFASQPKYGALWTAVTNIPSAIIFDTATDWPAPAVIEELGFVPGQWDWYWAEYADTYPEMETGLWFDIKCADFGDAVTSSLNEGLPLGLMTVDEAVELLDANLCTE
jgi:ABC-type glycerol-3-phosphate transport system substrate-binding protein